MKIAVFSDTRQPTKADGGHGLGMSAHSIATGLAERGHDITLCAGWGSEFDDGTLLVFKTESEMANWYLNNRLVDVVLDTSHHHVLSKWQPDAPVLNRIADMECHYRPPNAVVNSGYMLRFYPNATLVNTGIEHPKYFRNNHGGYLLFASRQEDVLGWHLVHGLAKQLDMPLSVASGLDSYAKWQLFANAAVLLHLSRNRAAPRLPVEVGYCGVPTVCFSEDGAASIVQDGLTGIVTDDIAKLPSAILTAMQLDRQKIRDWYYDNHDYDEMIGEYEQLLYRICTPKMKTPAFRDGDYPGTWGGYSVKTVIDGYDVNFTVEQGVRTIAAPCIVRILDGNITAEMVGHGSIAAKCFSSI